MLLSWRFRRIGNRHPGRNVETDVVVAALGQNLRKTEEKRQPNLRAQVRRSNRSQNGRLEEIESEGLEKDPQRLGRRVPGLHREKRIPEEDRRTETETYRTLSAERAILL